MIVEKYRDVLIEGKRIRQFAKDNYEALKERADKADVFTYGTKPGTWLGLFSPSLIEHKVVRNASKGRVMKTLPEGLKRYSTYESTAGGKPLRFRKFNKFGCDISYYFFEKDDTTYAVPFFRETDGDYPAYTHSIKYENGKLLSYMYFDETQVVSEEYDYTRNGEGVIICECVMYLDCSVVVEAREALLKTGKGFEEYFREKYNREPPAVNMEPRISRWQHKLYYEGGKLSCIEGYSYKEGALVLSNVIKCRKSSGKAAKASV